MKKAFLVFSILNFLMVSSGWASNIFGDSTTGSTEGTGSFVESFEFTSTSNTEATIIIELTNTSPVVNGGYITAFAFNNPRGLINDISLSSTSLHFNIIGDPAFENNIPANPFGDFDVGASSTNTWIAGGNPTDGIFAGDSETFTFFLVGSGFLDLDTQSFIDTLSYGSFSGQNYWLAVRFRGFGNGGSDKVPASSAMHTPIPGVIWLLGSGLIVFVGIRRKL